MKRPILVKLTKEGRKAMVLRNTKLLKGSNIWIDEDYSKRRELLTYLKEAKTKGHEAYSRNNKLIINN